MIRTTLARTEYPVVKKVTESEYPKKVKFSQKNIRVKINYNMPFRIKFLPGIATGSNPNNPAPIGVAIIGVNNYIL
jgi:hypothetical protein